MEKIVIIPGIYSTKKDYLKMIAFLSKKYTVYYFHYESYIKLSDQVASLEKFISDNKITEANFLTFSFGSIIFKLFYDRTKVIVNKLVELGPVNNGSAVFESFYRNRKFGLKFFGPAPLEYLQQKTEVFKIPLPKNSLLIIGMRPFSFTRPESYILPFIFNIRNSDGKVKIDEARLPGIKSVFIDSYHTYLKFNNEVLEIISDYFAGIIPEDPELDIYFKNRQFATVKV